MAEGRASLNWPTGRNSAALADAREAINDCEKVLKINPTFVPAKQLIATCKRGLPLALSGDEGDKAIADAIQINLELAEQFPTIVDYRKELAMLYYTRAKMLSSFSLKRTAILPADIDRAIEAATKSAEYYEDAFKANSRDQWNRVFYFQTLQLLASLYSDRGSTIEAESARARATQLVDRVIEDFGKGPTDDVSHLELGYLYQRFGRTRDALIEFARAIELSPSSGEAFHACASLLNDSGHVVEARADIDKSLMLLPGYPDHYFLSAQINAKLNDWSDALVAVNRAIDLEDERSEFLHHRATIYIELGRNREAIDDLQRVIDMGLGPSTDEQSYFLIAKLLTACPRAELRDPKRAIKVGEQILSACRVNSNQYLNAVDVLGKAYRQAGEPDKALEYEHKYVESLRHRFASEPTNTNLFMNLAGELLTCYDAEARNAEEAIELLQKARVIAER